MEPISIITGAIAFASSCVYTLRDIKDTISKLEEVPQTLSTLERKIALLSKVLSRLEGMIRDEQDSTAFLQDDVVIMVLEGCHDTLERLHLQLQRLWPLGGSKLGKVAKGIMTLWKEGDIAQMVLNVEREQSSLQFVMISHMSLDSPSAGLSFDQPFRSRPERRSTDLPPPKYTYRTQPTIPIFESPDQDMGGMGNHEPPPESFHLQDVNHNRQRPWTSNASENFKAPGENKSWVMDVSGSNSFL
ncbi:hypothetical protein B0T16DRAFT_406855 [Cercophora newfieldiana]|uniref:Fungal N-terminal domain-containing protein n=1 Tax=Cercophora newfieldiana TaxID=92897 RepID=A0AA39YKS0_9PEZI|nr:hypothetical protein B0T16DRAFT_406855 [Cercophora newfieldiana]